MEPWSLGGLPPPHWMCLVTCLRTFNMVTTPLYHAFKCMLEQEGPLFPVPIVLQTAAWTPALHNRNHPSPASLLICGSLHSVCTGAPVAAGPQQYCSAVCKPAISLQFAPSNLLLAGLRLVQLPSYCGSWMGCKFRQALLPLHILKHAALHSAHNLLLVVQLLHCWQCCLVYNCCGRLILLAIILRTYCPAFIRHTWSSEFQLLHDRPGNPWLPIDRIQQRGAAFQSACSCPSALLPPGIRLCLPRLCVHYFLQWSSSCAAGCLKAHHSLLLFCYPGRGMEH
jgi:hypothetical protein